MKERIKDADGNEYEVVSNPFATDSHVRDEYCVYLRKVSKPACSRCGKAFVEGFGYGQPGKTEVYCSDKCAHPAQQESERLWAEHDSYLRGLGRKNEVEYEISSRRRLASAIIAQVKEELL